MNAAPPINVADHTGLVVTVIRRHGFDQPRIRGTLTYDELIQAGLLGVWRATQKFDPALGFRFSTYACWWIRQSISRALADEACTIRVPVYAQSSRYRARQRIRPPVKSIDAAIRGDEDLTLADTLAAPDAPELSDAAEQVARIMTAAKLTEQEQRVIKQMYSERELTLREVGEDYGVSRERIRQVKIKALAKLRVAAERIGLSPNDVAA